MAHSPQVCNLVNIPLKENCCIQDPLPFIYGFKMIATAFGQWDVHQIFWASRGTVMDGSMNHPKWNMIVTYVACYFVSCILIWFTDTHLKSVPQLFQNKPQAFTGARCKIVLMTSFEPKPVNESHAKNGSKCTFSVLVVSFLHWIWSMLSM